MTRKWYEGNYLSGVQHSVNKDIRFKTPVLRSYFCDYSDTNVAVKETINTLAADGNENDKAQ